MREEIRMMRVVVRMRGWFGTCDDVRHERIYVGEGRRVVTDEIGEVDLDPVVAIRNAATDQPEHETDADEHQHRKGKVSSHGGLEYHVACYTTVRHRAHVATLARDRAPSARTYRIRLRGDGPMPPAAVRLIPIWREFRQLAPSAVIRLLPSLQLLPQN